MSKLNIGDQVIAFDLPGTDNLSHALADYLDKDAVVVIFSCNHCPYVQAWEDRMIAIQADYADKGVQLIAIGANDAEKYPDDNMDKMRERAQMKGFNFPYLRDDSQDIATAYGAERTPEVFLFDKDGKLQYHGAIDDNHDDPDAVKETYLRDALDAVLAGKTPSTATTPPVGCTIKWK